MWGHKHELFFPERHALFLQGGDGVARVKDPCSCRPVGTVLQSGTVLNLKASWSSQSEGKENGSSGVKRKKKKKNKK